MDLPCIDLARLTRCRCVDRRYNWVNFIKTVSSCQVQTAQLKLSKRSEKNTLGTVKQSVLSEKN